MTFRTFAAVLTLGVLWGLNWPAVKTMLTEMPPFTIRAVALTAAGAALFIIAAASRTPMVPTRAELPALLVAGLLTLFGFNVLVTFSQEVTETSKATIIAYIMPALTAIFAAVLLRERLASRHWLALGLGSLGIGVLAAEDLSGLLTAPIGPLLALASAISWALGNVATKARDWSLPPLGLTVWFLGISGLACWPFVFAFEPLADQSWPSLKVAAVMVWHIAGPMVLCYVLFTGLVRQMPAGIAALATLLAPVVGVTSSMWLLDDPPTVFKIGALALILASIAMTFLPDSRKRL